MPPPPLIPPEALADLDRLAGLTSGLTSPVTAGPDGRGVIYIGERGVETIDRYMDRVQDNLDWFWRSVLQSGGRLCAWEEPIRVWVGTGAFTVTSCGSAETLTGAFYCGVPSTAADRGRIIVGTRWMYDRIYAANGRHAEFAVASVLAHEMGHHMQDVLGYLRDSPPRRCCGLVRLNIELHADCLGGVWAHSIYGRGEIDLETMTQAVQAAGDFADTPAPGEAALRSHGTAEERRQWYLAGFDTGRPEACAGALLVRP